MSFKKNRSFYFYGNINIVGGEIQISHPEYSNVRDMSLEKFCRIRPTYGLTKGITQKEITNLIEQILSEKSFELEEYLPSSVLKNNSMCDINYAVRNIHFPSSPRALKVAKFRLVFEEFFFNYYARYRRFSSTQRFC